jgi:hypothetical protein
MSDKLTLKIEPEDLEKLNDAGYFFVPKEVSDAEGTKIKITGVILSSDGEAIKAIPNKIHWKLDGIK